MTRTNCYWYHEYRDMNMTVPYCEELRIDNPSCENECSCKYYISKDDADKIIRNAIEALSTEAEWIPCSERLPDEDYCTGANHQYSADVLITVHNADDEETIIDYGHTLDGAWYSDTTDCIVPSEWEVIAWMPLPKPYKGGDTE